MNKSSKLIVIISLLSLAGWVGFMYGQHQQVVSYSLYEQSQLITAARLDIKAIQLLDDNEIARLRTLLSAQVESNIAFIETWKHFQANSNLWTEFYPTQTSMSLRESAVRKEIEQSMELLESEYNEAH